MLLLPHVAVADAVAACRMLPLPSSQQSQPIKSQNATG